MLHLEGLEPHEQARLIPLRPVLVCYRGSVAHGTYVAPTDPNGIDDVDILVCYIPDLEHYFGGGAPPRGKDLRAGKWDCAAYELRHFCSLLANGNPNVLATLWLKREHYMHLEPEGEALIQNRDLFLSKRAYHSFGGYAYAQLKRMTSFKDVGPSACGCVGKFHAPTCTVNAEHGRGSTKRFATGFMGEKRKGLVEKFGYDTKNAAHLIRLLRMGIELFEQGTLNADRTSIDAAELIDVKQGRWLLPDVQAEAERLFEALKVAAHASTMREQPDEAAIERLLVRLLSKAHSTRVVLESQRSLLDPVTHAPLGPGFGVPK